MSGAYTFFCPRCGHTFEASDKDGKKAARQAHKRAGCVLCFVPGRVCTPSLGELQEARKRADREAEVKRLIEERNAVLDPADPAGVALRDAEVER